MNIEKREHGVVYIKPDQEQQRQDYPWYPADHDERCDHLSGRPVVPDFSPLRRSIGDLC